MTNPDIIEQRATQAGRGREAKRPGEIPWAGWKDIVRRVIKEMIEDRIMLVAAGITFFLVLALFPALAAIVSLYGLFADPAGVTASLSYVEGVLPEPGIELIRSQLTDLASQNRQAVGLGFLASFAIAFWSANNGVKALFEGMNVAYNEKEKRGFLKLTALSFVFTIGAMLLFILLFAIVGVIPAVLGFVDLGAVTDILVRVGRWALMVLLVIVAIGLLYKFGPSRAKPQVRWISTGGILASIVWIVVSIGFSFYLQNFANYNATYGSLGAAIGFMVWIWISVLIVLVGAELNGEMEMQTAEDTTTGAPEPIGRRGAVVSDSLGAASGEESDGGTRPRS
ncbi:YihY/virulence factor BrkB family protein [Fodinicurvata sp. EGI_FJ10296]|uniref:YihY/virulence factor BrkB family protein n=1 Tax=Fodinicurvata sp. EGI_FJ10296 TaxID=3231908 RepID=UPI00345613E5